MESVVVTSLANGPLADRLPEMIVMVVTLIILLGMVFGFLRIVYGQFVKALDDRDEKFKVDRGLDRALIADMSVQFQSSLKTQLDGFKAELKAERDRADGREERIIASVDRLADKVGAVEKAVSKCPHNELHEPTRDPKVQSLGRKPT